jgi:hypothetical protein
MSNVMEFQARSAELRAEDAGEYAKVYFDTADGKRIIIRLGEEELRTLCIEAAKQLRVAVAPSRPRSAAVR